MENTTLNNTNGMGSVKLPTGNEIGSGDLIVKKKKKKMRTFDEILNDKEVNTELTEEQAKVLIDLLLNENITKEELLNLNEGVLGSILGGVTGFAFGSNIGKLLANVLGIREGSPLYTVLTSRMVTTAIGAELGKKMKF